MAYGIGLSKTGTHSLAGMLERECASAHEPCLTPLLRSLVLADPDKVNPAVVSLLRARDRTLNLEFESNNVLGTLLLSLHEAMPNAKYVLTVREIRSWLLSQWMQQLDHTMPRHNKLRFGGRCAYSPQDEKLKDAGLFPARAYLVYWVEHHRRVIETIPPERLYLLPTEEIRGHARRIAEWLGLPGKQIDLERTRSFVRAKKPPIDSFIDPAYLDALVSEVCSATLESLKAHGSNRSASW
ncbi:MAG: hypothetical protein AAGC72_12420 [Planctomycetota bacterium]